MRPGLLQIWAASLLGFFSACWLVCATCLRLLPFHLLLYLPLLLPARCSKFVSGVLGSRTSPTVLLAGGLIATAALNVTFGFSTSLVWFCTWWAMNGMLQVGGSVWHPRRVGWRREDGEEEIGRPLLLLLLLPGLKQ